MKKRLARQWVVVLALLLPACPLFAQTDTAVQVRRFSSQVDRFTSSRAYQMTYIGVPLVVGALIVKSEDDHFRRLRQSYAPRFRYHYDDYLQYSPAVLMLGLKAAGVESRSSWGRMLVSDAFSVGIMAAVVNPLKSIARVRRPDGSSRNSFPSGHTATAFMVATMLHKEYGWRSPWYSIAGYSVATVTGLSRMLNNRHWLSDVMAGAGIGILATELGYYFADLIFKNRGIREISFGESFDLTQPPPSFFGFHLGLDVVPGVYHPFPATSVRFSTGSNIGVDGAWFFNRYLGIGGEASIASIPFRMNGVPQDESLRSFSGYANMYCSYPISLRWRVGAKAMIGYYYYEDCQAEIFRFGQTGGISGGAGISSTFRANQNLSVRFFFDYKIAPPVAGSSRESLHLITLGSSVNVAF